MTETSNIGKIVGKLKASAAGSLASAGTSAAKIASAGESALRLISAGARAVKLVPVLLVLIIGISSCGTARKAYVEKISSIRVHDFKVESFKMSGLRSADLTFSAVVYNPTIKLKLKDISISISHNGKILAYASPESLTLPRHSESFVRLVTKIELAPSASLMDFAALAAGSFNEDNISVRITATGVGSNIIVRKIDKSFTLSELKTIASGDGRL